MVRSASDIDEQTFLTGPEVERNDSRNSTDGISLDQRSQKFSLSDAPDHVLAGLTPRLLGSQIAKNVFTVLWRHASFLQATSVLTNRPQSTHRVPCHRPIAPNGFQQKGPRTCDWSWTLLVTLVWVWGPSVMSHSPSYSNWPAVLWMRRRNPRKCQRGNRCLEAQDPSSSVRLPCQSTVTDE